MAGSYWDAITRQRVSRRRVLQGGAVAAGAALVVGCGGGGGSSPTTPIAGVTPSKPAGGEHVLNAGGAPKAGGVYNLGTSVDFDTFDPHLSIAGGVGYFPRLYNAVINRSPRDATFRFDDLASKLEQPDPVTYVFTLRDNVMVGPNQLGVPQRAIDGNDIKATFDRIKKTPQSNGFAFVGDWIHNVEVSADGKTVTITTPKPYGYFFFGIGSPLNLIAPRELFEKPDQMKSASAGGGPFVLNPGKYTEGQGARLERNTTYYRKDAANKDAQLPYIDGISVKIIADRSALRTAFQSQQIDQYTGQNVDDATALNPGGQYVVNKDSTNTFIAFTMNPTKDPWKDDRVRQAAMYAINRQDYIDRVYKGEAKANGLVHWSLGDYALPADELKTLQPYDPKKSKDLIKAATGKDSVDITVTWPADSIIEEHNLHLPIWLQQMADAGFNVTKDPQAFGTWLDNYTNLKYDASLSLNQIYETPQFELDFHHSEGPARNHIYAIGVGVLYPEVDKAIDDSKSVTDQAEQVKKVQEAQRLIYSKGAAFLPIVTPYAFTLYQKYVKSIPVALGAASERFLNTWYLDKA